MIEIGKNFDFAVVLLMSAEWEILYPLEFEKEMMLVPDPFDKSNCRLPFASFNDDSSQHKHMILGSFVL